MSRCLTDNEIAAFIDGELKDRNEAVSHLNSCVNCFEQVATVRSFIEENSELSDQIDRSYEGMISDHLFAAYFRRYKRKVNNFINDLIPSAGGLKVFSGDGLSGIVLNRYSAIAATMAVAVFIVQIGKEQGPASGTIWKAASQSLSEIEDAEKNILRENKFDSFSEEQLEADPEKKNAFELGRYLMKLETLSASGEKENLTAVFKEIVSNPLINKPDLQLKVTENDFTVDQVKEQLELYLDSIDEDLIDYVEFGIFVEASKYKSVKSSLKDKVIELEISADDINKYIEILKQTDKSN